MGAVDTWDWPVSLTDADWQRKKGAIAKIAGETGIGDAMKAAQAAYNKVDFNKLDATLCTIARDRDNENMVEGKKQAIAHYKSHVEPARVKVKEIVDLAGKTAAEWKKNKLIPSSSQKAAQNVHDRADLLWMRLKLNSADIEKMLGSWDEIIERNNRLAAEMIKNIGVSIKNLKAALGEVIKNPTKVTWEEGNTSAHQRCRSMCNIIRAVPGLKKQYWNQWQAYGDFYAKDVEAGTDQEKPQVLQLVKTVATALKTFESNYEDHLQ
jgi:hypothetical protein